MCDGPAISNYIKLRFRFGLRKFLILSGSNDACSVLATARRRLVKDKAKSNLFASTVPELTTPSPEDDLIDIQTMESRKQILAQRLMRLTVRQREAIFLRYYEELPYAKIAEIMGVRRAFYHANCHARVGFFRRLFGLLIFAK